ncbi:HNH endonuclease [Kribbella sp. NBC_01505]|uniref:HNH endonuclease n=1 Tax=Kribbella sp. NBC_01505 TaxID=2903580 RepID=UPI00386E5417
MAATFAVDLLVFARIIAAVGISDRDRKILWSRSHGLCAICRKPLVADATEGDREAVVGQEAHIVARSTDGPRGGQIDQALVDCYDNLVLLCPDDHTIVDAQPKAWPAEKLRQLKAQHEAWAKKKLVDDSQIRVVPHPDDPELPGGNPLLRITTGAQVWDIMAGAGRYWVTGLDDEDTGDPELVDLADEFLQLARDYGEISRDIEESLGQVRNAKRTLGTALGELERRGILAFGLRRRRILKGGHLPPAELADAHLALVLSSNPAIMEVPVEAEADPGLAEQAD